MNLFRIIIVRFFSCLKRMKPCVTYNNCHIKYPYNRKNPPRHAGQPFRPMCLFIKEKSSKKNTMKTADSVIVVDQTFSVAN